jgi:hypothetical protein
VHDTETIEVVLHGTIRVALEDAAVAVESATKRLLSEPGTGHTYLAGFVYKKFGKWYKVPARAGTVAHTASAPDSPPASDTGRLRSSIYHSIDEDADGLVAHVSYLAFYGLYLELGTRLMEPRPALRPALYSVLGA